MYHLLLLALLTSCITPTGGSYTNSETFSIPMDGVCMYQEYDGYYWFDGIENPVSIFIEEKGSDEWKTYYYPLYEWEYDNKVVKLKCDLERGVTFWIRWEEK